MSAPRSVRKLHTRFHGSCTNTHARRACTNHGRLVHPSHPVPPRPCPVRFASRASAAPNHTDIHPSIEIHPSRRNYLSSMYATLEDLDFLPFLPFLSFLLFDLEDFERPPPPPPPPPRPPRPESIGS